MQSGGTEQCEQGSACYLDSAKSGACDNAGAAKQKSMLSAQYAVVNIEKAKMPSESGNAAGKQQCDKSSTVSGSNTVEKRRDKSACDGGAGRKLFCGIVDAYGRALPKLQLITVPVTIAAVRVREIVCAISGAFHSGAGHLLFQCVAYGFLRLRRSAEGFREGGVASSRNKSTSQRAMPCRFTREEAVTRVTVAMPNMR